jgi:hypothetical protein
MPFFALVLGLLAAVTALAYATFPVLLHRQPTLLDAALLNAVALAAIAWARRAHKRRARRRTEEVRDSALW